MKIYLDTNIVSALAKGDTPRESAALQDVLRMYQDRTVELATSELTLQEIGKYRGLGLATMETIYTHLERVPFVERYAIRGFHSQSDQLGGFVSYPLLEDDADWQQLRGIGLDETDAHHVMLAVRNECDVFLTCDERSIIRYRSAVELAFPIEVSKPSEWIAVHGAKGGTP